MCKCVQAKQISIYLFTFEIFYVYVTKYTTREVKAILGTVLLSLLKVQIIKYLTS